MELTMVNARCSRQVSFTILTMGDDLYMVVVSEMKSGPLNLILVSKCSYEYIYMLNRLTDGCS